VFKWKKSKGGLISNSAFKKQNLISSHVIGRSRKVATTDNNEFRDNNIHDLEVFLGWYCS
jgi:hypothetical protein